MFVHLSFLLQFFLKCLHVFFIIVLLQKLLRKDTKDSTSVVLGVILYSDATTVTQNQRESVWPIYMTLANIPLEKRNIPGNYALLGFFPNEMSNLKGEEKQRFFFSCMEAILKPLMELSHVGFKCKGKMLYPLLYSYVHDQPEGSKVCSVFPFKLI